jgi:hypothetical protein
MALSSGMDMGMRSGVSAGGGPGGPGGAGGLGGANCDDELKTQFLTREGIYRLMTLSEYSRPNRVGYANSTQGGSVAGGGGGAAAGCPSGPVKVSFVSLVKPVQPVEAESNSDSASVASNSTTLERITFNYGREIFVYPYRGVKKAADLTKPIDKRIYKGTFPTCHDFGPVTKESEIVPLVVGFSGGQIQLVDPINKEMSKLFNEEVIIFNLL